MRHREACLSPDFCVEKDALLRLSPRVVEERVITWYSASAEKVSAFAGADISQQYVSWVLLVYKGANLAPTNRGIVCRYLCQ